MIRTIIEKWPIIRGSLLRNWPFILLAIVSALHITEVITVDGYAIALLVLTFISPLLKTITTYFETFKIGKDGIEAKAVADNRGKTSEELKEWIDAVNSKPPVESVFPFSQNSRAILSTLWHFQKKLFGKDSLQRWGFGIGIGASDYRKFQEGLIPLVEKNLINMDQRGLCYLTNEGVELCNEHSSILDADGPFYRNFSPVPRN